MKMTTGQYIVLIMTLLNISNLNAEIMDVSCVYETTENHSEEFGLHHHKTEAEVMKWYFWRTGNEIEVSNSTQSFGEKWVLSNSNNIYYQALYHDKQFLLDFQPADLKILGQQTRWQDKSTLFPKRLLKQLTVKEIGKFKQYKMVSYRGKVAGVDYQVTWLPELDIPASVVKKVSGKRVITELKEVYLLKDTPYQRITTEKYDDMDYADIGDNESHPIVAQLQKNSGIGYFHQH